VRVRVLGELELVLGAFERKAREGKAERVVGLFENAPCGGPAIRQRLAHARELRALAGKEKCHLGCQPRIIAIRIPARLIGYNNCCGDRKTEAVAPPAGSFSELTHEVQRGFIAEWTVTIVLLLFATTTLVQAFVIPSASMVGTLLIGDHVLVDKLVYAPPGPISRHLLPYRDVRRGDIIVFRYPLDIKEDYVKRAIGVPGDHIHFVNQQLILNGRPVKEPYTLHSAAYPDLYRDNFPTTPPNMPLRPRAAEMLENHVVAGELVVPPGFVFAMGDNRDDSDDSRYWGLVPRENIEARRSSFTGRSRPPHRTSPTATSASITSSMW